MHVVKPFVYRWSLARRKNRPPPEWHSLFGEWIPGAWFEHSHAMSAFFTNNLFVWQADANAQFKKKVSMTSFVRDIVDRLRRADIFTYKLSTVLNTLNVNYFKRYTLLLLLSSRPGIIHTKQPAPKYARASPTSAQNILPLNNFCTVWLQASRTLQRPYKKYYFYMFNWNEVCETVKPDENYYCSILINYGIQKVTMCNSWVIHWLTVQRVYYWWANEIIYSMRHVLLLALIRHNWLSKKLIWEMYITFGLSNSTL